MGLLVEAYLFFPMCACFHLRKTTTTKLSIANITEHHNNISNNGTP